MIHENIQQDGFEKFIRGVIKNYPLSKYWKLEWREHKSRYVFKNGKICQSINSIIIDGQGVDIVGTIYGFQVAIEIKECYGDSTYLSSKLKKEQKLFLRNFENNCRAKSFVLIYFHKSSKLYIVKWPSNVKKIESHMIDKENVWLYKWDNLSLSDLCNQLGGIMLSII